MPDAHILVLAGVIVKIQRGIAQKNERHAARRPAMNQFSEPESTGVDIGAAIRRHREAVGMTVIQLARHLGVSRNTVANYEGGRTEPSASELVRLADALGCTIQDLLGGPAAVAPPRFAFRAHKKLREDPGVIRIARKYLRAYIEIEAITEARLTGELTRWELDQESSSQRWIEAVAADLRKISNIRDTGPENIASTLESMGVRCLFFDYEGRGLDGVSVEQGGMRLVLLHNRAKGVERTISSAAHELGHLVLHPNLFTQDPEEEATDRDYEDEANYFAGCFLVPTDELVRVWHEEHLRRLPLVDALLLLKRVFHVSFWFLFKRTSQVGLTDVKYPLLVNQVKKHLGIDGPATWDNLEPEPLPAQSLCRSTRFERLVRSAFIQDKIGPAKVAEVLQITVDDAHKLTESWLRPPNEFVE
jgi:Zn-dependent peptidase ImmA (M78 family)/DNA-binding XRE family transcriptional regulator